MHMLKSHKVLVSLLIAAIIAALFWVMLPLLISNLAAWVYLGAAVITGVVLCVAIYNVLPPSPKED